MEGVWGEGEGAALQWTCMMLILFLKVFFDKKGDSERRSAR